MRLRIGTSSREDVRGAAAEAARSALGRCEAPVFAFVFATLGYRADELAAALSDELGPLPRAGVLTHAVLAGRSVLPRGVAVGVVDSATVRARVGVAGPVSAGARAAGAAVARDALLEMSLPPPDRSRAVVLFTDTAGFNAAEVLHGAVGVAGAGVVWSGGGTGDGGAQLAGSRALHDHAVAVTLDCHKRVGVGVKHGWEPTGAPAMVTRVRGSLVERLEHRPAFEIYRRAAEERGELVDAANFARFAMTHPLGIPQADGEYLIRDPLSVDELGALRFLAAVPDGALVRVMEAEPSMLVDAGRSAAAMARDDAGGPLGGALVFDCVSRALLLGDRLADEIGACQGALGEDVPVLGCFTAGEVGAFGARMPQFHNKTMVVLALPA